MALTFFTDTAEFRKYVRGVDASVKLEELTPDYNVAKANVYNIIENTLWEAMKAYHEGTPKTDAKKNILLEYIQIAIANFTQLERWPTQAAFDTSKDYYKYQVDAIMAKFRNNAYNAMSDMINYLDLEEAYFTDWPATTAYTNRSALIVKDYKEFDSIYSIDGSSYFFHRTMFLQSEAINDEILPRIKTLATIADEANILTAVKRALVYFTMHLAIKRFDVINLPVSIRLAVTNEHTKVNRSGSDDSILLTNLAADLLSKAQKYFSYIEHEMYKLSDEYDDEVTEIEPNLNDDDNKFYFPG